MKAVVLTSLASCLVLACATGTYGPTGTTSGTHKSDGGTSFGGGNNQPPPSSGDDAGSTNTCSGTMCGADCVDTSSDPNNCGGCGVLCDVSATCVAGQCSSATQPTSNEPPQGTCGHSLCSDAEALTEGCDTAGCSIVICDPSYLDDTYCCDTAWDSQCIGEVSTYCAPYSCN